MTELNYKMLLIKHIFVYRGQTLEQVEKFDDPKSDDEDDGRFGGLGGKMIMLYSSF